MSVQRRATGAGPGRSYGRAGRRGASNELGAQATGVDVDAGAHRRRHGDLAQVPTLGAGRLGSLQLVEDGPEVGLEGRRLEARLAQRDVHVAVAVGAVLDLAALELGHGAP